MRRATIAVGHQEGGHLALDRSRIAPRRTHARARVPPAFQNLPSEHCRVPCCPGESSRYCLRPRALQSARLAAQPIRALFPPTARLPVPARLTCSPSAVSTQRAPDGQLCLALEACDCSLYSLIQERQFARIHIGEDDRCSPLFSSDEVLSVSLTPQPLAHVPTLCNMPPPLATRWRTVSRARCLTCIRSTRCCTATSSHPISCSRCALRRRTTRTSGRRAVYLLAQSSCATSGARAY